jgi:uncharacterized protein YciI
MSKINRSVMKTLLLLFFCVILSSGYGQTKNYTIVFLHKKSDGAQLSQEESKKIMDGHMANMGRLSKEGKLLAAGPFEGGGGLFIMNSTNEEEVKSWISTDPGVQAKRWNIEILPYEPRHGGICPVGEKIEMTFYTFVRFNLAAAKSASLNIPETMEGHNNFVKELIGGGKVITEAGFGENQGGILVFNGEIDSTTFESDPGVREGLLETQVKKLYIARGSFCEK